MSETQQRGLMLLGVAIVLGAMVVAYQFHRPNNSTSAAAGEHSTAFKPKSHTHEMEYMEGGGRVRDVANVVPAVGNQFNKNKAWNDTPTDGMLRGIKGTEAPNVETSPASTEAPGGMPVDKLIYCPVPTGYLEAIVNAWDSGKREGLQQINGLIADMGHGEGAFYDTSWDGCCDTYCRRVVKGGYWSCVTPQMVTTQYTQMNPKGTKCDRYGKRHGGSIH